MEKHINLMEPTPLPQVFNTQRYFLRNGPHNNQEVCQSIFTLQQEDYQTKLHTVLPSENHHILPSSFFILVIESQGKINGVGIIFNFGKK